MFNQLCSFLLNVSGLYLSAGLLPNRPSPPHAALLYFCLLGPNVQNKNETNGLEAVFLENRDRLLRFFLARGAGDAAEDLLQDLWLKISVSPAGPVASPLSYLFQAANATMIDRHRSISKAQQRNRDWSEAQAGSVPGVSDSPSADRILEAREYAALVDKTLDELGPRVAAIFRRHRIDEITQKNIAAEFGVSVSTVESDLRRAYSALSELKERQDEV